MASQQKNLLLQLVVEAVDRAGNVLNNIKRSLDGVQTSAQKAGDTASQTGDKLTDGLKRAADAADQTKKKFDGIAQTMAGVGAALAGIGAAITAPLAVAVKNAADFENQMNKVKAITNFSPDTATAQAEFQALTDKARELGGTTTFSATQAAAGLENFSRAGYTTAESIAAIGPALDLAFAENKDLASTSEGLVSIMSALGLGADQMTRATDVLAKTADSTTSSMGSLIEGFSYAAPVAKSLGMELELAAAFLGRIEQNGIKGERAGTGFRRVMEDLVKPTTEARAALESMGVQIARNSRGNLDAVPTFERLAKAGMTFEQASAIFGTQGATVALAIAKDVDEIKKLAHENDNAAGSLEKVAAVMRSGLNPSLQMLGNAANDVSIQFAGPFLSGLKAVVDGMAGALRWFTEFGKAHPVIAKAGVAITGVFGLIVAALGALSLVIAAAAFAWGNLVKGWDLLTGKSAGIVNFFREKISVTSQDTAAINQNTNAIQRNILAIENQRRINAASNPRNMGPGDVVPQTGRTGSGPTPVPVPTTSGSGLKFSGAGVASAAAIGGVGAAVSGSGMLDVVKWAGISVGMQLVISNAGVLAGKLMALVPSWATVTGWVGSFVGALKAAGLAVAAFAASPVGVVAGAIAAIVGTVVGGYKILSDRREAAAIQADTLKRSQSDLNRAMAEGFDPNKAMQKTNTAALTTDPYVDLVLQRKQAVADFTGWNEKLTQAREKDAQSFLGGKSKETTTAEQSAAIARQNIDLIQVEINKRVDLKDAVETVGKAQKDLLGIDALSSDNIFAEAAKGSNTLSGKLGAMKEVLDTLNKGTEAFYGTLKAVDEVNFGTLRNEIISTSSSQAQQAVSLADLEIQQTARRMTFVQQEYDEKKRRREQEFAAAMAQIAKDLEAEKGNAAKAEEIKKQRTETEKAHRDQSLQAEKAMQDAVITEIKKQQDAVKTALEERKKLEQDIKNEQRDASRIQHDMAQKSMSDMDKLRDNYAQAVTNLNAANALLPTMPEKAMELAKKARDEFKGLAQDINALAKDLDSTFKENQEMLRELGKKNMSPAASWVSDLDHVKQMLAEAEKLLKAGEFEKAAQVAGQARGPASGLAKAPEGSGFTDQQTAGVARTYLTAAIEIQEAAKKGGIEYAKEVNKGVNEGIGKTGIVIKTAQEALLDANTKQLQIHGQQTETLIKQYDALISQNNKLIEAQGGKGVEAPDTNALINTAKEGVQAGAQETTQSNQLSGPLAGAIGNLPSDLSPALNLSPDVQRQREEAQKLVEKERGQKLSSALEQFPELATMLSSEDYQRARSANQAEEDTRQARMTTIRSLESQAGAMDKMDARGYGVSPAWEAKFNAMLDGLMGNLTAGQRRLSESAGGALDKLSASPAGPQQGATQNLEAQNQNADRMGGVVESFKQAVEAVGKTFGQTIKVEVNVENGAGTITRY